MSRKELDDYCRPLVGGELTSLDRIEFGDLKKLDIVGIYHSHPDHPARPSETDLAAAWPK